MPPTSSSLVWSRLRSRVRAEFGVDADLAASGPLLPDVLIAGLRRLVRLSRQARCTKVGQPERPSWHRQYDSMSRLWIAHGCSRLSQMYLQLTYDIGVGRLCAWTSSRCRQQRSRVHCGPIRDQFVRSALDRRIRWLDTGSVTAQVLTFRELRPPPASHVRIRNRVPASGTDDQP